MYYFVNGGFPSGLPKDIQKEIIKNMMYGGLNQYQIGGENIPSMDAETQMYPENLNEYYPEADDMVPGASFTSSQYTPSPMGPEMPDWYSKKSMAAPPQRVNYQGVSVVDLLDSMGLPSDFSTRKRIAEEKFNISNYKGLPNQNLELLSNIMKYPEELGSVSSVGEPKSKKRPASIIDIEQEREVMDSMPKTDTTRTSGKPRTAAPKIVLNKPSSSLSDYVLPASAILGSGLGVYAGMRAMAPGVAKDLDLSVDLLKTYVSPQDIVSYAKKFGRDANTFDILRAKGMSPKDIGVALKGIKFNPLATQQMAATIPQMMGAVKSSFRTAASAIDKDNLDMAKRLVEVMRSRGGYRDPQLVSKVYSLVRNPAEANKLMKGLKYGKAAVSGAKAAGALSRFSKFIKPFFEEGGELMKYQNAGEVLPSEIPEGTTDATVYVFDPNYPDTWQEDFFEIADPTGMSSYDDIEEMKRVEREYPGTYSKLDKFLTYAGAVPVLGKVGKIGKGAKSAIKYILGSDDLVKSGKAYADAIRAKKSLPGKIFKGVSGAATRILDAPSGAVRVVERANPLTYGTGRLLEAGIQRLPSMGQKIVRPASKTLGYVGRMGKGSDVFLRGLEKLSKTEPVLFRDPSGNIISVPQNDPRLSYFGEHVIDVDPETGIYYIDQNTMEGAAKQAEGIKNWKKTGGSTYSAGVFYEDGGSFSSMNFPSYPGAPLPKYNYGSMMGYGGSSKKSKKSIKPGSEMYVTPEEMEKLRQQGYDFDVIG